MAKQIHQIDTLSTDLSSDSLFVIDNNENGTFKTRSVSFQTLKSSITGSYSSPKQFYNGNCENYYYDDQTIDSYYGIKTNDIETSITQEERNNLSIDQYIYGDEYKITECKKFEHVLTCDSEVSWIYYDRVADGELITSSGNIFINKIPQNMNVYNEKFFHKYGTLERAKVHYSGEFSSFDCNIYKIYQSTTISADFEQCQKFGPFNFKSGTKIIVFIPLKFMLPNVSTLYSKHKKLHLTIKDII